MRISVNNQSAMKPVFSSVGERVGDGVETSTTNYFDAVYSQEDASEWQHLFAVFGDLTHENLTPLVCDDTDWPVVRQVSNGIGEIKLANGRSSKIHQLSFSDTSESALIFKDYATFTYGHWAWHTIIKPLLTPGIGKRLLNLATGIYTEDCWAGSFDWSGVCTGYKRGSSWVSNTHGTLLTSRHAIVAAHYQPAVGEVMRWSDSAGNQYERTIIGKSRQYDGAAWSYYIPGTNSKAHPKTQDVCILVLSSALPESIRKYPIVAQVTGEFGFHAEASGSPYEANGRNEQAWVGPTRQRPLIWRDQNFDCYVSHSPYWQAGPVDGDVCFEPQALNLYGETITDNKPGRFIAANYYGSEDTYFPDALTPVFGNYAKSPVTGDSGCPLFAVTSETEMAFVGCWTSPTGGDQRSAQILNLVIRDADDDAIERGNLVSRTGYTVTVAPDPTL